MDAALFESIVGNWLLSSAKDSISHKRHGQWPDFELVNDQGKDILVELKTKAPPDQILGKIADRLDHLGIGDRQFYLVTPDAPNPNDLNRFHRALKKFGENVKWISIDQFPEVLNRPSPDDWKSPETWAQLKTSALVRGLDFYSDAPIGATPYEDPAALSKYEYLTRQFSYETIGYIAQDIEGKLRVGSRIENITVVLSDIMNFSSLVTASRPDDLKNAMSEYYRRARQAVFENGGMLDKFIGDAVLAVFGYPKATPSSSCDAMTFALELVRIGIDILDEWQLSLNAVIPTGTRVGIATGDIWPINIGQENIEITLLGDTINLAARLEKNCEVNKILIDNRTHTLAQKNNCGLLHGLGLTEKIVPVEDAKGQAFPIRAWLGEEK